MKTNFSRRLAATLCAAGVAFALSACADMPVPQAQPAGSEIVIDAPASGELITGTFEVRGTVSRVPDEQQLAYRLYDADGNLVASGPISVEGSAGAPGAFRDAVAFDAGAAEGPGEIEIVELGREGGAIRASAVANVYFITGDGISAPAGPFARTVITLTSPLDGAAIGSPAQVAGSVSSTSIDNLLIGRVYDHEGYLVGIGPIDIMGEIRQAGVFGGLISYTLDAANVGRVVIVDQDPDNGIVYGRAAVNVSLSAAAARPADFPFANTIAIESPADRARVNGAFEVTGALSAVPFEPSLIYRVYDAGGRLIGAGSVAPQGEPGQPGSFTATITYPAGTTGAGILEILDLDAVDGLVFSSAAVNVIFGKPVAEKSVSAANQITIENPMLGDIVGSPFEIHGSIAKVPASRQLAYRVYDAAGTLVGIGQVAVAGEPGGPGVFAGAAERAFGAATAGRVQVLDLNAGDGAVDGIATTEVFLSARD
jgi:hypothetical protein